MAMPTYEYTIFAPGSTKEIAASFSTTDPVPHIQVGHSLTLQSNKFSTVAGHHQVIVHVETYLLVPRDSMERIRTSVFLQDRERPEIFEL
jgi:hypothetical protein